VNPLKAYDSFLDLILRISLLKSLPSDALKRFGSATGTKGPFSELLRNLILGLAIGKENLVATPSDVEAFEGLITDGVFDRDVLDKLVSQFEQQIGPNADTGTVERLLTEIRTEIHDLVAFCGPDFQDQFVIQNV